VYCDICHKEMTPLKADLQICHRDGLISSNLRARVELYDSGYFQKHKKYAHTETDVALQDCRVNFDIRNVPEIERGEILDFGCGNGSFLKALDGNFGVKHGFDINPYECQTRIDYLLRRHDVVTFWDSLEHVESPSSILKGLNTKYVFITVPSIDDIGSGEITAWRHYRPHEHIHYFNYASLSALLESCGYEVIDHNYAESEVRRGGGSMNLVSIAGRR
jgi:hypothetical protein